MNYAYYPGCSLEGTAREYDRSTRALMGALGISLEEIPDWTCCGASAAAPVGYLLSIALPAINLARAADGTDILAPCSACYLNLRRAAEQTHRDPDLMARVNTVLGEIDLRYRGGARVRHLLDVLAVDVGAAEIFNRATAPFSGLTVAPYYGCQCLRPYAVFDDPERPTSMTPLIEAVGGTALPWEMGGKCCGASHMNTKPAVGLSLVTAILEAAAPADVIVTVCPMCQINLEAFQGRASAHSGRDLRKPVLYLPQLLGMAMGLTAADVGLDDNLAVTGDFRKARTAAA